MFGLVLGRTQVPLSYQPGRLSELPVRALDGSLGAWCVGVLFVG
jgi:hypothetical protein